MIFNKFLFKSILLGLLLVCLPTIFYGQSDNVLKSDYKLTNKGLVRNTLMEDSTTQSLTVLKPILIFKGKYEISTESGDSRFSVRNARIGVQGDLSKKISYKFMIDASDNGSLKVLDLYVAFKPHKRLKFTFGQGGLPIFNSYTVSPNSTDFVNRPFVGKYINSSRDIGLTLNCAIKQKGFPISLEAGLYNGDGINNAKWTGSLAYGGRLAFGSMKGWRATAKFFKNDINDFEDYFIWGADLRYDNSKVRFETEYMNKHNCADFTEAGAPTQSLSTLYAQGMLKFPVSSKTFKRVEPALRWDGMGYDLPDRGLGVNRATVGVNLVLNTTSFVSLFRVNYEHYFNNSMDMSPVFTSVYHNENKLSAEFLLVF